MKRLLCGVAPIALLLASNAADATTAPTLKMGYSSPWLAQIGVTAAIQAQAFDGHGITIGFIDSGVIATRPELIGRVSTASSCAATTFRCASGYYDDDYHGTS